MLDRMEFKTSLDGDDLSRFRVGFEDSLGRILREDLCVGCGSCVISCPLGCLEYADGKPVLIGDCSSCGVCSRVCPRYECPVGEIERFIFGRERMSNEEFGVYRRVCIARTRLNEVRVRCQDGGVVTTLLIYALEDGLIDGAVVSGFDEDEPLRAVPMLAKSKDEILSSAGSRYAYSPNLLALRDAVSHDCRRIAFVGVPCQIEALRRIQILPVKRYAERLSFAVGLFCGGCFSYDGLAGMLRDLLGLNPNDALRVRIKGEIAVLTVHGDERHVSLRDARGYFRRCNLTCTDFSAELADVSVGGIGLEGWTVTVLRSSVGEGLFDDAASMGLLEVRDADMETIRLLVRASRRKRRIATSNLRRLGYS